MNFVLNLMNFICVRVIVVILVEHCSIRLVHNYLFIFCFARRCCIEIVMQYNLRLYRVMDRQGIMQFVAYKVVLW